MTHTAAYTKRLPAPSIRKLLRDTGWTQAEVARRHGCKQSFVSRVIAKHFASDPLWSTIAWCLNHPRITTAKLDIEYRKARGEQKHG